MQPAGTRDDKDDKGNTSISILEAELASLNEQAEALNQSFAKKPDEHGRVPNLVTDSAADSSPVAARAADPASAPAASAEAAPLLPLSSPGEGSAAAPAQSSLAAAPADVVIPVASSAAVAAVNDVSALGVVIGARVVDNPVAAPIDETSSSAIDNAAPSPFSARQQQSVSVRASFDMEAGDSSNADFLNAQSNGLTDKETVVRWQMVLQLFNYYKRDLMFFNLVLYMSAGYIASSVWWSAVLVPTLGVYFYGRFANNGVNTNRNDERWNSYFANLGDVNSGFQSKFYGHPYPVLGSIVANIVTGAILTKAAGMQPSFVTGAVQGAVSTFTYLSIETWNYHKKNLGRSPIASWAGSWHSNLEQLSNRYMLRFMFDTVEAASVALVFHQLFLAFNAVALVSNWQFLPLMFAASWTLNNTVEHFSMFPRPLQRLVPRAEWGSGTISIPNPDPDVPGSVPLLTSSYPQIGKRVLYNFMLRALSTGLMLVIGAALGSTQTWGMDHGATNTAEDYSTADILKLLSLLMLPILIEGYARTKLQHRFFAPSAHHLPRVSERHSSTINAVTVAAAANRLVVDDPADGAALVASVAGDPDAAGLGVR